MQLYALKRRWPSRRLESDGIVVRMYHKKADAEVEARMWSQTIGMRVVPVTVKERKP